MIATKYRVSEEFRAGYVAALAITGCPPDATEHFRAGFEAGYKAKEQFYKDCPRCQGSGTVLTADFESYFESYFGDDYKTCPECRGDKTRE